MTVAVAGIPTGVHVILPQAGAVLLMRRANTGFFDGLFSLPGGHVEAGESIRMAAIREMAEELDVCLTVADLDLVGVVHRLSDTNRIDFFLRARRWQGEPRRAEPDKCDALGWYSPAALPANTVAYIREALGYTRAEPWVMELGWLAPAADEAVRPAASAQIP
ncbi:NUDIX hydrolase [Denitromonas ohlonensis]|jgi:ADP-ribose pyrophosphatase YjhB (NUDIX family)|uniref:NUDIX domain-containing protein n=2 Tax=Denitromonas TaxID=139331 RepID=A0A558CGX8_9RHOO|nr:NUDIX domain-containing protein [Denitromonas ohlonensis]TVT48026.1 MAG: NUDIX domain-containing protein [Denitromonas halophila]TVO59543.1 NUDIX domain-containing protein [Denitromonas ohlonensis]TVO76367.1 NUDIX domain-containing protein [Denitromonas ohlonensis]TVT66593.1 MAG: NUDIX domain-containing protein [Denitromonas halophila]TVT76515.1 MAG: NUDIX domain-containing protein [Denitromonas halophila]